MLSCYRRAFFSEKKCGRRMFVDDAATLLIMQHGLEQCRLAAMRFELNLPHNVGNTILQFQGALLKQRIVILAAMNGCHTFFECIDLRPDLRFFGSLCGKCRVDSHHFLGVGQAAVGDDALDRRYRSEDALSKPSRSASVKNFCSRASRS